ncbi:hypothetical protein GCM10029978_028250 [Actinoallomurus acanthiterrae]
MKARRITALVTGAIMVMATGGCGGGGGDKSSPKTLTYWASNQGRSIQQDQQVLGPELKKFEQQTGIKVKLEVIGWPDLLNRILAATSSGKGPDVLNIGNTWSASLQATGAFQSFDDATIVKVGGRGRFIPSTLTSTGAAGKPPGFVPLYGLAYGLFYNKKLFAQAGLKNPPATWQELVADAKKLTDPGKKRYGVGMLGASYTEGAHFAFMFGAQNGARLFQGGQPGFDSPAMVAGVRQYLDLLGTDKVVDPADAEYVNDDQILKDFAAGKFGMMMIQSYATAGVRENGMKDDAYGVEQIPLPDPLPAAAAGSPATSPASTLACSRTPATRTAPSSSSTSSRAPTSRRSSTRPGAACRSSRRRTTTRSSRRPRSRRSARSSPRPPRPCR